jgi:hypothetical protein
MSQKPAKPQSTSERLVRDIRRATRKHDERCCEGRGPARHVAEGGDLAFCKIGKEFDGRETRSREA